MFISFHFIGRPDDCHVYIYKSLMHRHEANAQDAKEKKKKKKIEQNSNYTHLLRLHSPIAACSYG